MFELRHYIEAFSHLHTAKVKGHKAPHKAVMPNESFWRLVEHEESEILMVAEDTPWIDLYQSYETEVYITRFAFIKSRR